MQLAAEWGSGQVLWSILWFFLFFVWFWLVIMIFSDLIRSDDLNGWAKAAWALAIIFLPYLGILIYLIVRGGKMGDRAVTQAQKSQEQMDGYIRQTAGTSSSADELTKLAELHNSGKLDDAEYANAKAKVLNS
ncbi:MAG: SHOCT domain-containing protein [Acidimicrobiia bacterium]|nr:SHOCT domain-containing protein [Acidimicrobiia bacterium]